MLKKIFTATGIKILFTILISFFLVKTAAPQIFLADTPRLNPDFIARLQNAPQIIAVLPSKMLAGLTGLFRRESPTSAPSSSDQFANVKIVTPPPNVIFKPVAKGVYAGEDPTSGQKYIKIEAGTKYRIIGTVTINGVEYPQIEFVE